MEEEELLVTTATSVSLSARTSWPPLPTDPPHSPLLTGWFIQMAQGSAGGYGLPLPSMGLHLRDPKDEQISIPEIHYLFTETFWLIVGQVQAFFWTFRKKLKAKKTQAKQSKTQ